MQKQKVKHNLTQEELKKYLHYNPDTGIFTWIISVGSKYAGNIAGSTTSSGYIRIAFNKKYYLAHRLAFLYIEGYFPENCVDHIDRNPGNNKWENLREVSRVCNSRNCDILDRNTSGITGVSWCKADNKWMVGVRINQKRITLGRFDNKLDAAKCRWEAEVKYGWPNCCSTSSAYLYLKKHNKEVLHADTKK